MIISRPGDRSDPRWAFDGWAWGWNLSVLMRGAIGPALPDANSEALSEIDAMAVAQPVSAPLTRAASFLVVTINPGPDNRTAVPSFCADLPALIRAVEFRD